MPSSPAIFEPSGEDLHAPVPPRFIGDARSDGPLFLTCEHASNVLPREIVAGAEDLPWLNTHWAWDIGATSVVERLCDLTNSPAILAGFSRLVCDPNRDTEHPNWIRLEMDGHRLDFNRSLENEEHERRRVRYYKPYHQAIHQRLEQRVELGRPPLLLAVHSFTQNFQGEERWMEMGVVFDECEEEADRLFQALKNEGFRTALNAPYSGALGQMYSPRRHGLQHGVPYLEIEMRNDLFAEDLHARTVEAVSRAVLEAIRES